MPLLNLVVMLIVIGVGLYLINRYIAMASKHQNDSECRSGGCRLRLAIAGGWIVGGRIQLPAGAMTGL